MFFLSYAAHSSVFALNKLSINDDVRTKIIQMAPRKGIFVVDFVGRKREANSH